ncbi:MAG: CPBP family intramembrane metalloprotease [Betaproteobacteria bacterium]|nr:CPBP family intramembrane metalloprotease [Betaproteobacteria bacterium]
MIPAGGLQIAFLILAVEFFAMLLSRQATRAFALSPHATELLGQCIALSVAAAILFGVKSLRRWSLNALAPAPRKGAALEVLFVALGTCAIPFAVVGACAGWAFVAGVPGDPGRVVRYVDPVEAWSWTLSPPGLARMLLLAWFVGPVLEELVFRGLLYRAWERQFGWVASLLLTSACFGLAHPTHVATAFLASVVYTCVLRRTGTLRAAIQVHILYNILVSWPLLGRALLQRPDGALESPATWALPFASLAFVSVALPAYLWMARRDLRADGTPPASAR